VIATLWGFCRYLLGSPDFGGRVLLFAHGLAKTAPFRDWARPSNSVVLLSCGKLSGSIHMECVAENAESA
jgi:hypothetical protein